MKDDLHKKIIEELSSEIDPNVFEAAAVDILQEIYPSLTPIKGGGDDGRDGHFFNINGGSGPLVCTTGVAVEANLKKSLKQFVKKGHTGKSAIFVTSQRLTPKKQTSLLKIAKDEGFKLIKIHEQSDMALRLYRKSVWLKKLLNLESNQKALSVNPVTSRPVLSLSVRGRGDALKWLGELEGDGLIVGQPGSGKTFLVREFIMTNDGLFVVGDNRDKIVAEIRDLKPRYLVIDDAHTKPELLQSLRQIREDTGAEFQIIATGWLSQKDSLKNDLTLTDQAIYELELQGRDTILEIIKDCGVSGPDRLLSQMVTQAEGKPGLAATLSQLVLGGDSKEVQDVYIGDALGKHLVALFKKELGADALDLLAVVSMGGDSGISISDAASILGISEVRAGNLATELAFGGVIADLPEGISVRPAPLRYYLAKSVFFKKNAAIDPLKHLHHFNRLDDVIEVSLNAALRGGVIDRDSLYTLIEKTGNVELFAGYAAFGKAEAERILSEYPEQALRAPDQYLASAPEIIIPLMLEAAVGDDRPLHSNTSHPLRIIQDWAKDIGEGSGDPILRRKALIKVLSSWKLEGKDSSVFAHGLSIAYVPHFEIHRSDPGAGNSISFGGGHLTPHGMNLLMEEWPATKDLLSDLPEKDWYHIVDLAEEWVYEQRSFGNSSPTAEQLAKLHEHATVILRDIAPLSINFPGIQARIKDLVEHINAPIDTKEDREFEIIFPRERNRIDWEKETRTQRARVKVLAAEYANQKPIDVITRVKLINTHAEAAQKSWPNYTNDLATDLANEVDDLVSWAELSIREWDRPNFSGPFLSALHSLDADAARPLLLEALNSDQHRYAAAETILRRPFENDELWQTLHPHLEDMARLADVIVLGKQADEKTIAELLSYTKGDVALMIAHAVDHITESNIPSTLMPLWEDALIRYQFGKRDHNDHYLSGTLKKHPATALKWLKAKINENPTEYFDGFSREAEDLIPILTRSQKIDLIQSLPNTTRAGVVCHLLVGNDIDLFKEVLSNPNTKEYQLRCLSGLEGEHWVVFVESALSAGCDEDDIRQNTMTLSDGWSGSAAEHWKARMGRFDAALLSPNPQIISIATKSLETYQALHDEALSTERKRGIYGR